MLVSVIIPVYKMEKYLETCVSSVIRQSYEKLEIILVDDGSPDKCPKMCDDWVKRDKRIRAVHKANGGISSARNVGLDIAKGDFLFFLDSDDAMARNTIKILVDEMKYNSADIVSCSFTKFQNDKEIQDGFETVDFIRGDNTLFFSQVISNHGCGKLVKKQLFDHVRFPEGKTYEDVATTHFLFSQAKRVSHTASGLVFYRQHNDSITRCQNEKKLLDIKWAYERIKNTYEIDDKYGYYLLTVLFLIHSRLQRASSEVRRKTDLERYVAKEFKEISSAVDYRAHRKDPMFWKIMLYRFHLSKMVIHTKILLDGSFAFGKTSESIPSSKELI